MGWVHSIALSTSVCIYVYIVCPLPYLECHVSELQLIFRTCYLCVPFWYWLTWVVLEKGPLNGCVCVLPVIMMTVILCTTGFVDDVCFYMMGCMQKQWDWKTWFKPYVICLVEFIRRWHELAAALCDSCCLIMCNESDCLKIFISYELGTFNTELYYFVGTGCQTLLFSAVGFLIVSSTDKHIVWCSWRKRRRSRQWVRSSVRHLQQPSICGSVLLSSSISTSQ